MKFTTKRPILIIAIGYILGIIEGLYFKISVVPFFLIIAIIIHVFFKKHSSRYFRYLKLYINFNAIVIILLTSCLSSYITRITENDYKYLQKKFCNSTDIQLTGRIISSITEKEYEKIYTLILSKANIDGKNLDVKGKKVYIKQKKSRGNLEQFQKVGDIIEVVGKFELPEQQRNYKGFDYNLYLKTQKIIGILNATKIVKKANYSYSHQDFFTNIQVQSIKFSEELQEKIKKMLPKDISSIIIAFLLGNTELIDEQVEEDFRNSNLSHVLAISGLHITYLISITLFSSKIFVSKRNSYIICIFLTIIYMFMTGFSPSIVRAVIMGIIFIISKVFYKFSDTWTSIALSCLCILISNPYSILNIGFQLSYGGTIGIILFQKMILKLIHFIFKKVSDTKIISKIIEIISVTISAQIVVLPICIYHFNTFSIYFLITNLLVGFITEIMMGSSFIFLFLVCINENLARIFSFTVIIVIKILLYISKIGRLPFSIIYFATPHILQIILYMITISIFMMVYYLYNTKSATFSRIKNIIALFKFYIKHRASNTFKNVIKFCLFGFVFTLILTINTPKDLSIHFVDVGQGDGTFIETPKGKTILIDGGGSFTYDVGKNMLLPYILDRGYTKIDFIILSHFDIDHVGAVLTIMENLEVKNIIIGKQFEKNDNYEKFLEIAKRKKVNLNVVQAMQRLNIEKNLYLDILWPDEKDVITENSINNNSLVFKLVYNNFSMLFTGDIEEVAENKILSRYKDTDLLKADIIKIAHHGSKTSSSESFLETVSPKIALIGVGKNNNFGHPSNQILDRLENFNTKIYRTDECGEITINVNKKGKIVKIEKCIKP